MRSVTEAREAILAGATVLATEQLCRLQDSLGAVLAQAVNAAINVPGHDNSAMDGYAVCADAWVAGCSLPVVGVTYAGQAPAILSPGTAQRIFTGAPLPAGADAVVIQEDVHVTDTGVCLREGERVCSGDNIRRAGEDIECGELLFGRGHRLRAQDVGLLASVGCEQLAVFSRLRVGLLCTGDELRDPGEPLLPGQIYNSNRYLLAALLGELGCDVHDAGKVRDSLDDTVAALRAMAQHCDVIISTGGVSVGDADVVKAAVQAQGSLDLWKIAVKPGKPLAFGHVCGKPFFGLPGNPVSAFVTFLLFVRPFLQMAQGGEVRDLARVQVQAAFDWSRAGKREEYLRVQLQQDSWPWRAQLYPQQSSGALSSVCRADALLRVPVGQVFATGDEVECWLL